MGTEFEGPQPRYLFVSEVARELRTSADAVRYQIAKGALKSGRVGGRRVVRPADLDAFIEAGFAEAS